MLVDSLLIEHFWLVEGYPDYFVGQDNRMYRIKNNYEVRECKLTMVGYSKGYVLKSNFHSLKRLRELLLRNQNLSFEGGYLPMVKAKTK
jgi:hypothetical protein